MSGEGGAPAARLRAGADPGRIPASAAGPGLEGRGRASSAQIGVKIRRESSIGGGEPGRFERPAAEFVRGRRSAAALAGSESSFWVGFSLVGGLLVRREGR